MLDTFHERQGEQGSLRSGGALSAGSVCVFGQRLDVYRTEGPLSGRVVMASRLDGGSRSSRGLGVQLDGDGLSASLEAGWPVALGQRWVLEPQAQVIWQHLSLDDAADAFSTVAFDSEDAFSARIGGRLHGSYDTAVGVVRPYLKVNLWHDFASDDQVTFGADRLVSERRGTALEIGGGVVSRINEKVSVFAVGDLTRNRGW